MRLYNRLTLRVERCTYIYGGLHKYTHTCGGFHYTHVHMAVCMYSCNAPHVHVVGYINAYIHMWWVT